MIHWLIVSATVLTKQTYISVQFCVFSSHVIQNQRQNRYTQVLPSENRYSAMLKYSHTSQTNGHTTVPLKQFCLIDYSLLRMIWARLIFCWSWWKRCTLAGMPVDSLPKRLALAVKTYTKSLWTCDFSLWTILPFSFLSVLFSLLTPFTHLFSFSLWFLSKPFSLISISLPFPMSNSLCCCPAVLQCVVCQPEVCCQRPWAHQEKEKRGRRKDGVLGWGAGPLMNVWSRAVTIRRAQTHARLMWCAVGGGAVTLNVYTMLSPPWPTKTNSFWPGNVARLCRMGMKYPSMSLFTSLHLQLSQVSTPPPHKGFTRSSATWCSVGKDHKDWK